MHMPSFGETRFVCKNCRERFSGSDTEEGKKQKYAEDEPLSRFMPGPAHPKCPHCKSRKTEEEWGVEY